MGELSRLEIGWEIQNAAKSKILTENTRCFFFRKNQIRKRGRKRKKKLNDWVRKERNWHQKAAKLFGSKSQLSAQRSSRIDRHTSWPCLKTPNFFFFFRRRKCVKSLPQKLLENIFIDDENWHLLYIFRATCDISEAPRFCRFRKKSSSNTVLNWCLADQGKIVWQFWDRNSCDISCS